MAIFGVRVRLIFQNSNCFSLVNKFICQRVYVDNIYSFLGACRTMKLRKQRVVTFSPSPEGAGLSDSSNTFGFIHRLEFDTVRAYYDPPDRCDSRDHLTNDWHIKNASSSHVPAPVCKPIPSFFCAQPLESLNRFLRAGGRLISARIPPTCCSLRQMSPAHHFLARPEIGKVHAMQDGPQRLTDAWPLALFRCQGSCPELIQRRTQPASGARCARSSHPGGFGSCYRCPQAGPGRSLPRPSLKDSSFFPIGHALMHSKQLLKFPIKRFCQSSQRTGLPT